MFEEYPVVTNESQKLKMDVIGQIQDNDTIVNGLTCQQQLFSRLLTSINPFAQFIVQEQIEQQGNPAMRSKKNWVLDEAIFKSPEAIKKENLYKTSAEMFSIYIYLKDPMMQVKSDKYTDGEFKKVKDLISIEDSLLVSSQMSNSLLYLEQQQKLIENAQKQKQKENPFSADAATKAGDVAPSTADAKEEVKRESQASDDEKKEAEAETAPPADDGDASLADMNKELHNLMGI